MKKGVIALILLAVLIIIVSPGIVGKLAEQQVDENLNWAAEESGELVVTSQSFDRGWFSSEGQYRVALGDGQIRAALAILADNESELPVLLINTHLDHGLIPVSSLAREQGSLAPGLGSAVSTMAVEFADGERFDVPGTIYSTAGLGGELDSRYLLEAGSTVVEDGEVTWQESDINVAARSQSGEFDFDGVVGTMTFGNQQQLVTVDGVTFDGSQVTTEYGFNVGDVEINVGPLTTSAGGQPIAGNQGINFVASSSLEGGLTAANMRLTLDEQVVPMFGNLSVFIDMAFDNIDAASLQALTERLEASAAGQDPTMIMATAGAELQDLVAAGFNVNISQLDVALPMGTVESNLSIVVPKSDSANFEWTSLLLKTEASMDLKIPEALVQLASSMDPQVGMLIAGGFLVKNDEFYEMDADLKQGLLKVNGAPIPIPLGALGQIR